MSVWPRTDWRSRSTTCPCAHAARPQRPQHGSEGHGGFGGLTSARESGSSSATQVVSADRGSSMVGQRGDLCPVAHHTSITAGFILCPLPAPGPAADRASAPRVCTAFRPMRGATGGGVAPPNPLLVVAALLLIGSPTALAAAALDTCLANTTSLTPCAPCRSGGGSAMANVSVGRGRATCRCQYSVALA